MPRSRVLLVLTVALTLAGFAAPQATAAPGHRDARFRFHGPRMRLGIGFHGDPHYSYRHLWPHRFRQSRAYLHYTYRRSWPYRYRDFYPAYSYYPQYPRRGVYVSTYPTVVYGPYRSHVSSQGYDAGSGAIQMRVDQKEAQVFVDGYYAGIVDDFDGTFQKLYLQPGEHTIELRLEGYRTFTRKVLISPRHTQTLHHRMRPLGPGDTYPEGPSASGPYEPQDEPPPERARPSSPPGPSPAPAPAPAPPSPSTAPSGSAETYGRFGVLRLRVQPAEGEIRIDGEPWGALGGIEDLSIHLPAGIHRIELHREGVAVFATDVEIRRGETTPLNIRLAF